MVRATMQARRLQRLQQLRAQDHAYSTQLAAESKRSRHAAEAAAVVSLGQTFEAERASRETQLQQQHDAAMLVVGQAHADAHQAQAYQVERASEQYWAFVRSQHAERQRSQAARDHATNERLGREAPRIELMERLHRVKQVEQDRAAAAAEAAAAAAAEAVRQQTSAPLERLQPDLNNTPSTSTHLHAVHTSVVIRETEAVTAFEAARIESEKAAAARRTDVDMEAARNQAAAERGREALARMRSDQLREQVKQQLLDAQLLVDARERNLAVRSAAMQAKQALSRASLAPGALDDVESAGSDETIAEHSEHSKQQVDGMLGRQAASPEVDNGIQAEVSPSNPTRHTDGYREHLRIRARALKIEQEQLERSVESELRRPDLESVPTSAASRACLQDDTKVDAARQTARTSQRIGELDLALDRLLHRLAPSSSGEERTDSLIQRGITGEATGIRRTTPDHVTRPLVEQSLVRTPAVVPTDAVAKPSDMKSDASGLSNSDAIGLSDLPGSLSKGANGVDGSRSSDTLSCSSLSSDTCSSTLGANSTQTFAVQSDLSEDDTEVDTL